MLKLKYLEERFSRFRISANAVYPYDCEGKLYFLRLTPAEETATPLLREELRFIRRLRRRNWLYMNKTKISAALRDGGPCLLHPELTSSSLCGIIQSYRRDRI